MYVWVWAVLCVCEGGGCREVVWRKTLKDWNILILEDLLDSQSAYTHMTTHTHTWQSISNIRVILCKFADVIHSLMTFPINTEIVVLCLVSFFSMFAEFVCSVLWMFLCVKLLEVRMQYELNDIESPDGGGGGGEHTSALPTPGASPQTSGPPSHPSTSSNNSDGGNVPCLKYETCTLTQTLRSTGSTCTHTHTHKSLAFCLKHTYTDLVNAWSILNHGLSIIPLQPLMPDPQHTTAPELHVHHLPLWILILLWSLYLFSFPTWFFLLPLFTLSLSPQSAQYSSEAVSRLPGRFSGPVSVGEWRASSADHMSGAQFLLRPVSRNINENEND